MTAFTIDNEEYNHVRDENLLELLKKPFKLADFNRLIEKYT